VGVEIVNLDFCIGNITAAYPCQIRSDSFGGPFSMGERIQRWFPPSSLHTSAPGAPGVAQIGYSIHWSIGYQVEEFT